MDVFGYLANPTEDYSSKASNFPELCYPANLYETIWLKDGSFNPNNYWAAYFHKTVEIYKDHFKNGKYGMNLIILKIMELFLIGQQIHQTQKI